MEIGAFLREAITSDLDDPPSQFVDGIGFVGESDVGDKDDVLTERVDDSVLEEFNPDIFPPLVAEHFGTNELHELPGCYPPELIHRFLLLSVSHLLHGEAEDLTDATDRISECHGAHTIWLSIAQIDGC